MRFKDFEELKIIKICIEDFKIMRKIWEISKKFMGEGAFEHLN